MIAALATIAFLAAAWAAIVAIAGSFESDLGRIKMALQGRSTGFAVAPVTVRVSQRYSAERAQPVRARPSMRAAA